MNNKILKQIEETAEYTTVLNTIDNNYDPIVPEESGSSQWQVKCALVDLIKKVEEIIKDS